MKYFLKMCFWRC